jgi:hypothetical protein
MCPLLYTNFEMFTVHSQLIYSIIISYLQMNIDHILYHSCDFWLTESLFNRTIMQFANMIIVTGSFYI